ncbi:MAG: elongation factor 1-alpha [Magnetococcales bacterium]|nr:elongation factor 1-alpha [Magnetococcales bacterium]|tara:strand:- start:41188 stop:42588 length:1401 start_codon:yes stop_codon:yes gene_type:complete
MSTEGKQHLGVVICGHVDAGKSTTTGHLLFRLGVMSDREKEKLEQRAKQLGKDSFSFAFYMDTQKDEQERGITISCRTKEFYTDKYHYSIIDAPGHRDFIKNMISGAAQADVAVLMVPADGNFEKSIARGNHKKGEVMGQTRQHANLCNLLGINQLIVCINKMDEASVNYSQKRFDEIKSEVSHMIENAGYKGARVPFIPISGFKGDNLVDKSDKMDWYKGFNVQVSKTEKVEGYTLLDALNNVARVPKRATEASFRMPVSGVYKIKGVGDVITGRIEQGTLKPNTPVQFCPSGSSGKVFTIEMHHKTVSEATPGDNVGLNVKALPKEKMPKVGDIMYDPTQGELKHVKSFRAVVVVQDHPGQLRPSKEDTKGQTTGGFTPSVFVRTSKAPCRLDNIHWRQGKKTQGAKIENPEFLEAGDQAEITVTPKMPFYLETFTSCKGLGRVAFMDSNTLVMLGKVLSVEYV